MWQRGSISSLQMPSARNSSTSSLKTKWRLWRQQRRPESNMKMQRPSTAYTDNRAASQKRRHTPVDKWNPRHKPKTNPTPWASIPLRPWVRVRHQGANTGIHGSARASQQMSAPSRRRKNLRFSKRRSLSWQISIIYSKPKVRSHNFLRTLNSKRSFTSFCFWISCSHAAIW